MKKYILILILVAFELTAIAQKFTPVYTDWSNNAYVNNVTTLSSGDIIVYGNGEFLPSPAPPEGFQIRDKKIIPLDWEIPNNTEIIIEYNGTIYLGGALGIGMIVNDHYQKLITTEAHIFAMCVYRGSLYFGGTIGDMSGVRGNIAKYKLSTGELTVDSLADNAVKSIVPFAKSGEDTSLYVLCDTKGAAFLKLDGDLNSISMESEESAPKSYTGIEMKIWNNQLVVICWGENNDGYIGTYDGYDEWGFSRDINRPSRIDISPNNELYISGTVLTDSGESILSKFETVNECFQIKDENGRTLQSITYGPTVFTAWDQTSTFIIMNNGTWIEGYPDHLHVFRLDTIEIQKMEDMVVYPNPNDGNFLVSIPGRFYDYVSITDMGGRRIFFEPIFGNEFDISINVSPGMYFIQCGSEYTQKIIIK